MTMSSTEPLWLTPHTRDRLQAELDQLSSSAPQPTQSASARILELRDILRRAEVDLKPDDGLVEPGMVVTVIFDGDAEPTTFLLAQRGLAGDDPGLDLYSPASPLGEAITGKYPGDTFSYTTQNGAVISGAVRAASPFQVGEPTARAADHR